MQTAILLGTYNGATFLQEQLDSFAWQTEADWTLWASDDGSTDDTVQIIRRFAEKMGDQKVHQLNGPQKGFAANFFSMVKNKAIQAEAYAYSDQDDIWIKDKLERASQFLKTIPSGVPALYCSRTHYVNRNNHSIGCSKKFTKPTIFANALVQNIASGNTMVFNQAARDLLLKLEGNPNAELHDWLTYILVTAVGGQVRFDMEPSVRYRQHGSNLIGMNTGLYASAYRINLLLFKNRFKRWNDQHIAVLKKIKHVLMADNQKILEEFINARKLNGISKVLVFKKIGLYRQTFLGNLAFYLAALINKV